MPECPANDLTGRRQRQGVHELDHARILVRRELYLHVRLNVLDQFGAGDMAVLQDNDPGERLLLPQQGFSGGGGACHSMHQTLNSIMSTIHSEALPCILTICPWPVRRPL